MKKIILPFVISLSLFNFGCSSLSSSDKINIYDENGSREVVSDNDSGFRKANYFEASKINAQLGVYYLDKGLYKRAKEKLLLSLKQYHDYGPNLTAMAYYYEKTGDPQLAEQYYINAVNISRNNGYVLNNYGTFLCRQKKYNEAISHFNQAIQDKNYLNTGEAYENAAMCAEGIPDRKLAVKYYERALQKNPDLQNSLVRLIRLNYEDKKLAEANRYLGRLKNKIGANNPDYKYLHKLVVSKKG